MELWRPNRDRDVEIGRSPEFGIAFENSLRELDGNFIATNRYPGRFEGEGHFHIAEFHNPSVEEFVEEFVATQPDWLNALPGSAISFRQLQTLLQQGERSKTSIEFWNRLRAAAVSAANKASGYLVNYGSRNETRSVWSKEPPDSATVVRVLLAIESHTRFDDARRKSLLDLVTTKDGWRRVMNKIANDDSIVYAVERLRSWIVKESKWPKDTIGICGDSYRAAVLELVGDEDEIWFTSMSTLRMLADSLCSIQSGLTETEQRVFIEAARTVSDVLSRNLDDPSDVTSEAEELESLSKLCGVAMESEVEKLRNLASTLEERASWSSEEDPERNTYSPVPTEDVDLDSLFSGLLDR